MIKKPLLGFFAPFIIVIFLCWTSEVNASIVILNGLTHENSIQPGSSYKGTINVQNSGNTVQNVKIYLRDYLFYHTGETKHDQPGSLERSNASWISYSPELLTLKPGELVSVNFEVSVPPDDSLKGTYWSVVMVEEVTPPDTSANRGSIKINTSVRYAIQIITNIGNTGRSDMEFVEFEMAVNEGRNILNVALENTGERILKPELNLELFDESGNSTGIIKSDRRKMYPATSIKSTLDLEGIKPGNYQGVLVVDCGEERLYGTNLSLEVKK